MWRADIDQYMHSENNRVGRLSYKACSLNSPWEEASSDTNVLGPIIALEDRGHKNDMRYVESRLTEIKKYNEIPVPK